MTSQVFCCPNVGLSFYQVPDESFKAFFDWVTSTSTDHGTQNMGAQNYVVQVLKTQKNQIISLASRYFVPNGGQNGEVVFGEVENGA